MDVTDNRADAETGQAAVKSDITTHDVGNRQGNAAKLRLRAMRGTQGGLAPGPVALHMQQD